MAQLPAKLHAGLQQQQQQLQQQQPSAASTPALGRAAAALLWSLLERFVDPLLLHVRADCREAQPSVDTSLVSSLLALLEHHLLLGLAAGSLQLAPSGPRPRAGPEQQQQQQEEEEEEEGGGEEGEEAGPGLPEGAEVPLQYLFAFCCVWGLGGGLEGSSRDSFDSCFRGLFAGVANFPEGSGGLSGPRIPASAACCAGPARPQKLHKLRRLLSHYWSPGADSTTDRQACPTNP
jgi:hypothetical protein